jgi:hypothetical protein
VAVSGTANFDDPVESATDNGGAAVRWYVAGSSAALAAGTTYYVRVACGSESDTTQFTTTTGVTPKPLSIPVAISAPPYGNVATVRVEYGTSPVLGSSVTSSCAAGCRVNVPAVSGTVLYVKRVFLDAAAQVVGQSGTSVLIAR